jgi:hypothetical protein
MAASLIIIGGGFCVALHFAVKEAVDPIRNGLIAAQVKDDMRREAFEKQRADYQTQRRTDLAVLIGVLLIGEKDSASPDNGDDAIQRAVALVDQVAPPPSQNPAVASSPDSPPDSQTQH